MVQSLLSILSVMLSNCSYCITRPASSGSRSVVVRFGYYLRQSDRALVQRYRCQQCRKTFITESLCYRQKKRHMNASVYDQLVSGVSQRRTAFILGLNRKTVVRKFIQMGIHAKRCLLFWNQSYPPCKIIEFDDLETFEHSKCKPLSITLAVEYKTRRILSFQVSQMPAKGHLVAQARKKYGPRKDRRGFARNTLFKEIKKLVSEYAVIKSDQNPHYVPDVKRHFPKAKHEAYKGRRGCVVGQGELKRGGFDPIYSLNHTCAMFRANINRLFRRTWCTTKKAERLGYHLALYSLYHNVLLIR